ncbi:16S rRNA processing protein RimM [Mogibacterium sp. NSJ-24]|uniref:Ribosome maturation factor RimM n=1 Tax=Lentihominibacter hominis TaxID=2763645 RepID=A0A926I8R4_9FIRM|nr:ribosome maturation factor RimM [Lentihominibacter hominis]MBC8567257.1 16S rRNA processing protein RimM [Lentihominibacter hominis]
MDKIKIGKIVNTVGLKGEVKVYNYSDRSEIYENTSHIYVENDLTAVESVRVQKNMVILKLEGISDRDRAEALRGRELYVTEEDLPELPQGQYYVRDIIGMAVREENGTFLGEVTDVIQNTAQDIFEVKKQGGKKVLIPKVDEFVLNIDIEKKEILVRLIDGLMDL